ncbi:hypothetical protein [Haloarcula sp. JP-L23]|uniref:hypothetical protein n=1 Tax=Haloarcula sp. JP-L23 TaxID=2716717 RepID=UPI00140EDA59|nr:hypothetical protein G9465_00085 [Haloarcula sp. JP-L23]
MRDEVAPALDIHTLLDDGSIAGTLAYGNGGAYQTATTVVLRLSGEKYLFTEILSPVLGSFAVVLFIIICITIVRRSIQIVDWWDSLVFVPVFFVFGGFVLRPLQTSHKSYTFIYIFVLIYAVNRLLHDKKPDGRFYLLAVLTIIPLCLTNYIWGVIYGGVLTAPLLFSSKTIKKYGHGAIVPAAASVFAIQLPLIRLGIGYFQRTIINPLFYNEDNNGSSTPSRPRSGDGSQSPLTETPVESTKTPGGPTDTPVESTKTPGGPTDTPNESVDTFVRVETPRTGTISSDQLSALQMISEWPSVPGTGISAWFVYIFGILVVAGLSAVAAVISVLKLARRELDALGLQFLIVSIGLGVAGLALFVAGDYATLKRVIVVPGILGTLVWTVSLASETIPEPLVFLNRHRRALLAGTFIVLLLSAALAVPRVTLDGRGSPYDDFAGESQVTKISWYDRYANECLQTHQELDLEVSARLTGERVRPVEYDPGSSVVYDSGGPRVITCSPS